MSTWVQCLPLWPASIFPIKISCFVIKLDIQLDVGSKVTCAIIRKGVIHLSVIVWVGFKRVIYLTWVTNFWKLWLGIPNIEILNVKYLVKFGIRILHENTKISIVHKQNSKFLFFIFCTSHVNNSPWISVTEIQQNNLTWLLALIPGTGVLSEKLPLLPWSVCFRI